MNDKSDNMWRELPDPALEKEIGKFVKHHRLQQNKSQSDAAKNAGISRSTLSLLERGKTVTVTTLIQVLRELDLLHTFMNTFTIKKQVSPIALAKLAMKERKRGRSIKESTLPESDW